MAMFIGIPIIVVWVLLFPTIVFIKLFRRRGELDEKEVYITYGLFFIGLDDHSFYWELIVVNLRKIIFILCSSILSLLDPAMKVINCFNTIGSHWNFSVVHSHATEPFHHALH
jgi:hypothetical protein